MDRDYQNPLRGVRAAIAGVGLLALGAISANAAGDDVFGPPPALRYGAQAQDRPPCGDACIIPCIKEAQEQYTRAADKLDALAVYDLPKNRQRTLEAANFYRQKAANAASACADFWNKRH